VNMDGESPLASPSPLSPPSPPSADSAPQAVCSINSQDTEVLIVQCQKIPNHQDPDHDLTKTEAEMTKDQESQETEKDRVHGTVTMDFFDEAPNVGFAGAGGLKGGYGAIRAVEVQQNGGLRGGGAEEGVLEHLLRNEENEDRVAQMGDEEIQEGAIFCRACSTSLCPRCQAVLEALLARQRDCDSLYQGEFHDQGDNVKK
jgi:hypothetical protein